MKRIKFHNMFHIYVSQYGQIKQQDWQFLLANHRHLLIYKLFCYPTGYIFPYHPTNRLFTCIQGTSTHLCYIGFSKKLWPNTLQTLKTVSFCIDMYPTHKKCQLWHNQDRDSLKHPHVVIQHNFLKQHVCCKINLCTFFSGHLNSVIWKALASETWIQMWADLNQDPSYQEKETDLNHWFIINFPFIVIYFWPSKHRDQLLWQLKMYN